MFEFIARILVSSQKGVLSRWLFDNRAFFSQESGDKDSCACKGDWVGLEETSHGVDLCAKRFVVR